MKRALSVGSGKGKRPRGDDEIEDDFNEAGFDEEPMVSEDSPDPSDEMFPNETSEDVQSACWSRGSPDSICGNDVDLAFQWCDIDVISGSPLSNNPDGKSVVGSSEGPVPIIRLYGVTAKGSSVLAFVHGFTPYFFASLASGIDLTPHNLSAIRDALDQRVFTYFLFSFSK